MDPLSELEHSLAYMFELQSQRTGEYINPLVQKLKKAIDSYKTESTNSLETLITAIKQAMPIIDNYLDSYRVKVKMEILASTKGKSISWSSELKEDFHQLNG